MTGLDELRAALTEPPPVAFTPIDVEAVIRRGGRKRRVRRLSAAGATVFAFVCVLGCVVTGAHLLRSPAASPVTTLAVAAGQPAYGTAVRLSAVVDTNVVDAEGSVVLFFTSAPARPDSAPYQLVLGHRTPTGLTADVAAGPRADSPGFHAVTAGRPGRDVPLYGYYSGQASRIAAEVGNLMVTADTYRLAQPPVTVFWFPKRDRELLTAPDSVPVNAYDESGNPLTK